jgi:hypothetical protein
MVYGPPGSGKTTMFSNAPNVLMVQVKDESVDVLKENGQIGPDVPTTTVESHDDLLGLLRDLRTEKHDFKFVVLDGASGMNEFADEHATLVDCEGERDKFLAFGRGEKFAAMHWSEVLEAIKDLKQERQMRVIILAHKDIVTIQNPDGTNYLQFRPGMGKEKFSMTNKYVDAMLLIDYVIDVTDPNKPTDKIKVAGKAKGGTRRIMYTQGKASFEAKNRFGLPAEIPLGANAQESWELFVEALNG